MKPRERKPEEEIQPMSIRITSSLRPGDLFTTDGKDVWELESFYDLPSFTMHNLRTGQRENFGQGGLMADRYIALAAIEPFVVLK